VFFFPTVDLSAVRAGKSLSFHFRRRPEFFFNRATSVRQLRGGRTTHEQAFHAGPDLRFRSPLRWFKIESSCHFRAGKRSAPCRYRRVTSPFSPGRPPSGE